jgi:aminomethyltransferase
LSEKPFRTQLYEAYAKTAKLTVFAGFEMPLYYRSIAAEHLAVRNNVGLFDISHMGRVLVKGDDSERLLNRVITNDVSKLLPFSAQYSVMCNENGGILDDFVVYRLEKDEFLVVFNANNRKKDFDWLTKNARAFKVNVENVSDEVAMCALQGPKAEKILQEISNEPLGKIERFRCSRSTLAGIDVLVSRTGYTGEDGFEIFIWNASISRPSSALKLWNAVLEAGRDFGIEPCGLGARDTLRLEAGLCLYGSDIDEETTPLEAGLGFVVKLQKEVFIGKEALLKQKGEGVRRKRVGIIMLDEGIPRPGFELFSVGGQHVGRLTSGTFSPLLRIGIGMGYVEAPSSQEGSILNVKIRQRIAKAKLSAFPLYDPQKYGYKRQLAVS